MNERKDNRYMAALIFGALEGFGLWVILIRLKAAGVVTMHWALVLSGLVWLTWIVYACTALAAAIVYMFTKLKRRRRRRKNDARIIAQCKGFGIWDRKPIVLGGRALELKAWEDFKIKRKPGEPDAHLRRRCMAAADNELANAPSPSTKKERHDELDAYTYSLMSQIYNTFQGPSEIHGIENKTDAQKKGESANE